MIKHRLYKLRFKIQSQRPQSMWQHGDHRQLPVGFNSPTCSHHALMLKTKQVELSKLTTQLLLKRKEIHKLKTIQVKPELIQHRNAELYKSHRQKQVRWALLHTDSQQARESRLDRAAFTIQRLTRPTIHTLLLLTLQVQTKMPASHHIWKESMMGSCLHPVTRVDRICHTRLSTTTSI